MEISLVNLAAIALLIETVVQAVKSITAKELQLAIWELVSIGLGVVIAVFAKVNLLDGMIQTTEPVLLYLFYVFSGVALGRGPSFVHDLWSKLKPEVF